MGRIQSKWALTTLWLLNLNFCTNKSASFYCEKEPNFPDWNNGVVHTLFADEGLC